MKGHYKSATAKASSERETTPSKPMYGKPQTGASKPVKHGGYGSCDAITNNKSR